jgi:hypothetical protein
MIETAIPSEMAAILNARGADVGEIALRLRTLVQETIPMAIEQSDPAAGLVSYALGPHLADTVCVISPQRAGVNFGLYRATELPDPAGLMTGTGKLHRHVKELSLVEAGAQALCAPLHEAAIRARARQGTSI